MAQSGAVAGICPTTGLRQALGQKIGRLEPGYRADILFLDDTAPILAETPENFILDTLIFSGNTSVVKDVMIAGNWVVQNFRHRDEERITSNFIRSIKNYRQAGQ